MYYKKAGEPHKVYYRTADGNEIKYWVTIQSTLATKFDLIFDQVNTMLQKDTELRALYEKFIIKLNEDPSITTAEIYIPRLFQMIDKLGEELGYHEYTYDESKKTLGDTLRITEFEYLLIMKAALRSKFVCPQVTMLREIENTNTVQFIYSKVMQEMFKAGTVLKLEKLVDNAVTYASSNGLDHMSQLWVVFTSGRGIDPQNIALRERNHVFYKGLPTISPGRDPIKWLIAMVRTSVKYLMKDKITQINIAVNNSIEAAAPSKAYNMLENFIYQQVISSRKLMRLIVEMPFANSLVSEYVYPITQVISVPFISMVFNLTDIQLGRLTNLVLLNLFTYKFMQDAEDNFHLFELLTCKAIILTKREITDKKTAHEFTVAKANFIKMKMPKLITKIVKDLDFESASTYTEKQLIQCFRDTLKTLFKYDYVNYAGQLLRLDYAKITEEYIMYIYNLSIGLYNSRVQDARDYIMQDLATEGDLDAEEE